MEYVRIDSESGDEREMCLKVEKDLKDLGADVIRQGHGQDTHSNGWNLLCTLKGSPGLSPLILSAHLDTVSGYRTFAGTGRRPAQQRPHHPGRG